MAAGDDPKVMGRSRLSFANQADVERSSAHFAPEEKGSRCNSGAVAPL